MNMKGAMKLVGLTSSSSSPLGHGRSVRLIQVISKNDPKQPSSSKLDSLSLTDQNTPNHDTTLNVKEERVGEGYSTRSDEQGFGGIYSDNQESNAKQNIIRDPAHHERSQGNHEKEKEKQKQKGCNQTEADH